MEEFPRLKQHPQHNHTKSRGRELNVHKTFRGCPWFFLNVLFTYNLRPVSRLESPFDHPHITAFPMPSLPYLFWAWGKLFKRQSYKIIKHTQTTPRLLPTNGLSCFWSFCGVGAKRVNRRWLERLFVPVKQSVLQQWFCYFENNLKRLHVSRFKETRRIESVYETKYNIVLY